ncbi:MAG: hypothetical protein ACK46X_02495 [Candidatus Sericytochromatia bacterium]
MRSATRMIGLMAVVLMCGACGLFGISPPLGMGTCPSYDTPVATVAVNVVDTDGQPVKGARVRAVRVFASPSPAATPAVARLSCAPAPLPTADTDAKGAGTLRLFHTGTWAIEVLDASADPSSLVVEDGQTYAVTLTRRPASPSPAPSAQ